MLSGARGVLLALAVAAANEEDALHYVTYGSMVGLRHEATGAYLTSDQISWSGGSGQAVTAEADAWQNEGARHLWRVDEGWGASFRLGRGVRCGDSIRLQNASSGKYLTVRAAPSALSRRDWEVSLVEENAQNAKADLRVGCTGPFWRKADAVTLRHAALDAQLESSRRARFSQANCPRCPIVGHFEVVGKPNARPNAEAKWTAQQGLLVSNFEDEQKQDIEMEEKVGAREEL